MAPGSSSIGAPVRCPIYTCFFPAMYARLLLVGLARDRKILVDRVDGV
jgi:hypothetical protein